MHYYVRTMDGSGVGGPKAGETSWKKPVLLGKAELGLPSLTRWQAAKLIQGMYKINRVRLRIKALIRESYEKYYDKDSQMFYYHNTKTNEVTWSKPRGLGDEELFMPEKRMPLTGAQAGIWAG